MNRDERIQDLFLKACDLGGTDRRALLDRECGDDVALRERLEALLDADARAGREEATAGLADPVRAVASQMLEGTARLPLPERIGPYRILDRLGEGGMGVVYRAEQTDPIHREVALKLIRGGFDSGTIVARFQAERQALALMDHPGIARVYEAGTTPDGLPYFAMEYVHGRPISAYCTQERLSITQRLELFLKVCAGVQHAHHKGILHRDLKPSNILVTGRTDPVPKIIDFGIAKAIDRKLTDRSLATVAGSVVGTLEYMSPEQASGLSGDIDLRSDVYSLGVILFELLSERLPCEIRGLSMTEAVRRISEENPARLGACDRRLRGDLETIVHKALEKERARRYSSPETLAEDIRRYLAGHPILARAPSVAYQLRKLIGRQKLASALVAILVLVAGAGLVMNVAERRYAEHEALVASTVSSLLMSMFESADPLRARGPDLKVRELIDSFDARALDRLDGLPEVEYRVRIALAEACSSLGLADRAYREFARCEKLLIGLRGPADRELGFLRTKMAWCLHEQSRYAEARDRFQEVMAFLDDENRPRDSGYAGAQAGLADTLAHLGHYDAARENALEALREFLRVEPTNLQVLVMILVNLSIIEKSVGSLDSAEAYARRAIELAKSEAAFRSGTRFLAVRQLVEVLVSKEDCLTAEDLIRDQLTTLQGLYPAGHASILLDTSLLGECLLCQNRYEEAEVVLQNIDARAPGFGFLDEHETAAILDRVTRVYEALGQPERAEVYRTFLEDPASPDAGASPARSTAPLD